MTRTSISNQSQSESRDIGVSGGSLSVHAVIVHLRGRLVRQNPKSEKQG